MKPLYLSLVLVLATSWPLAWAADDEDHASHHPEGQGSGAEHQPGSLHARMQQIEALMERIRSSSDAAERGRLLAEHLNAMRDQMKRVRKLSGGTKMTMKKGETLRDTEEEDDEHAAHKDGGDAQGGGMMKKKRMMMGSGGMMGMHKKMEQRMQMLERMLEQLIEHEAEGGVTK
jgi:hypothetical protein